LKPDQQSPEDIAGRFRTTHWSEVLLSAQSQAPGSQAALAELCRIYWYPIYAFVRRRGYGVDDAQDLTQGFFLHLLDHKALRQVSRVKGKFRSFLAASLENYLLDMADHARRLKRGGNVEFVSLDTNFADYRYRLGELDFLTADKIFDARWAMTLLDEVMTRLYKEYATQGKAAILQALEPFLNPSNVQIVPSYEQASYQLQISIGALKTLIHRLRKRYTALLREEVARTVSDPAEIDQEIHSLCEALVASEGRLGP
jgi:RNA polymerase sigma factor (sigma-70 family)